MPGNRMVHVWRWAWGALYLRALRTSIPTMRFAPYIYLSAVTALVAWGIFDLRGVAATADAAVAQTAADGPQLKASADASPATAAKTPFLDELKDRLDNFKWMLSIVLGVTGLFTVVQGIAAGFNAQNFQKQSDAALERLEDKSRYALEKRATRGQ